MVRGRELVVQIRRYWWWCVGEGKRMKENRRELCSGNGEMHVNGGTKEGKKEGGEEVRGEREVV